MWYSALIGKPTEHSVSPLLFEWIASHHSQPVEYKHLKIDIDSVSKLDRSIRAFDELGFCGLNVTLPYKVDIVPMLDSLDKSISSIGAVNTVVFDKSIGHSVGYNTDWYGIYRPLSETLSDFQKRTVIIFGTGGAARAAVYACLQLGIENIILLYRIEESKQTSSLKDSFSNNPKIHFDQYEHIAQYIESTDILINATPAGMVGRDDATPFSLDLLKDNDAFPNQLFFDCVFNPVDTPLLSYFESKGSKTIDGLWMMIYQGLYAYTLWTGVDVRDAFTNDQLKVLHSLLQERIKDV